MVDVLLEGTGHHGHVAVLERHGPTAGLPFLCENGSRSLLHNEIAVVLGGIRSGRHEDKREDWYARGEAPQSPVRRERCLCCVEVEVTEPVIFVVDNLKRAAPLAHGRQTSPHELRGLLDGSPAHRLLLTKHVRVGAPCALEANQIIASVGVGCRSGLCRKHLVELGAVQGTALGTTVRVAVHWSSGTSGRPTRIWPMAGTAAGAKAVRSSR